MIFEIRTPKFVKALHRKFSKSVCKNTSINGMDMVFIYFDICHQMALLGKLKFTTLTHLFKFKYFNY